MTQYRVNRFIQRTCRTPQGISRLNEDLEAAFAEFGLAEEERKALRDGGPEAMGRIGVHPILQMHWRMARAPELTQRMSILQYTGLVDEA